MPHYVSALLFSLLLSATFTPLVRRLAVRFGALDRPIARSVHTQPVPFLGGLAIFLAFALSAAYNLDLTDPSIVGILSGSAMIVLLGAIDDYRGLSPKAKLTGQIGAAGLLVLFGVRIEYITNPFGGLIWLHGWGIPLTILWVVAVINVINLMDGLDGLAAGIASIAALTLLISAIQTGQSATAVLLAAALAGGSLGFLPFNFNPAKIFMGDAGSMFLGFALAAVSVEGTLKSPAFIALAVPLLALGLPIADTFFAIMRRWKEGRPIGEADKGHLHHRLLALGLNQREAVLAMYLASGWLGVSALTVTEVNTRLAVLIVGFVGFTLYLGAKKVGLVPVKTGEKSLKL